jgi:hypothetical protein
LVETWWSCSPRYGNDGEFSNLVHAYDFSSYFVDILISG